MNHGSLFNGIGGFQLAAKWMGWTNLFSCEIDEWCNKITKKHFPDCVQHGDIKQTDFTIYRGKCDILTGGFPCQPFSGAGKRKGTEDNRYLWDEMLRAICEVQPGYVVGENVRGLTNWNGGLVFDKVQADLETAGYEVLPFLLPACAVNAPHRRDRIWFVAHRNHTSTEYKIQARRNLSSGISIAHPDRNGRNRVNSDNEINTGEGREYALNDTKPVCIANAKEQRFQKRNEKQIWHQAHPAIKRHDSIPGWQNFPAQPPVCSGDDGLSRELDGISFSKWRTESIKAYGNAIVPQVAYEIFKSISQTEKF